MGNVDRIDLTYQYKNLGNIMYEREGYRLRPIDQICPLLLVGNELSADARRSKVLLQRIRSTPTTVAQEVVDLLDVDPLEQKRCMFALRGGLISGVRELDDPLWLRPVWEYFLQDVTFLGLRGRRMITLDFGET